MKMRGFFAALCLVASCAFAHPTVDIATMPLFNGRGNVHPNVLLSLSVEFPTVGVAYRGDGGAYNRTTEYVGYFNPLKCYDYNGGNRNLTDSGYFYITKDANATTHECGGSAFSGNFMNWATSSAIDMLRLAMTGGDRAIDTRDMTVLQRAMLMDTSKTSFYANSTYFPRRSVREGGSVSAPSQVTPFNVKTLYIVSCRNRVLFSDTSSGVNGDTDVGTANSYCTSDYSGSGALPKAATDKKLGEYLARVRVCDANEGASRTDLCKKYGNNYKPVGEIQNRAGSLRLGAMGYLLDDAASRYGGVLRAPMKYVGPKKIDTATFAEVANDRLEWDQDTGVFYNNPDDPSNRGSISSNSGVVNYLNKFGRSASYKELDPVSELYYEGIRYFQGKQPTPDATAGMTEAMKDGFPVISSWADPVIASCQNNYILSISDVNTHWDRYIPGNNRTNNDSSRPKESADNNTPELDVKTWTKKVGDMESNTNGQHSNASPNTKLAGLESLDTGAGGHGTYYMAGLAYWANTNNIRLDKATRVKTFTIDVDEGGNGLIDGNTRSLKPRDSQLYLAAKYGGFNDINGDGNPFVTSAPDGRTISGSNVEWDNGAGVPANYFLAGQPRQLIQSIRKIFSDIGNASGTISGVSVSSSQLTAGGAFVYQPGFESGKWSGSLKKLALGLTTDGALSIASQPTWDAGTVLSNTDVATRKIYTSKFNDAGVSSTVEFVWANLSDTQKAFFSLSPDDGTQDGLGQQRVDFLRGERTLEVGRANGIFRARAGVLGDIVNSNPAFVGAPAMNVQGAAYQTFYTANKNRTPAVYVGSNDGMLHAFNANDGGELFAYVPSALTPTLGKLTSQNYLHRPYVDGPLTAGEAMVNGRWKTVLVSAMGGGAQGVFALDVTNPAAFGGALWEFTDADDADMGNVIGVPLIAKFQTGAANGVPSYKHFAVVSSGLNNYKDDGENKFNADAASALFLLSLDKSPSDRWTEGVNYFKVRLPASRSDMENGLGAPAFVIDTSGAVRYVYAGDLQGNLWHIDFSSATSPANGQAGSTPLFTAQDGQGNRQPITMQPRIVFAPGGGYVVLFGTGKFVENADAAAANFKTQSFYAIYDRKGAIDAALDRRSLVSRSLERSGNGLMVTGDAFIYGRDGAPGMGWYIDFLHSDQTGERAVTNPVVTSGLLFFNSIIPGGDPCGSGGSRSYTFDVLAGLTNNSITGYLSQIGMLSSPVVFQSGLVVGERNAIGRRVVDKKYRVGNFGTNGASDASVPISHVPAGRFSWREILNWQEVRNALIGGQ